MANSQQHVRPKPANMPSKQPNSNSRLRDWLYGEHYPDSFLDVPGPLRSTSVATLGDYIKHLQKIDRQSYQSGESGFSHVCPNNPILTCNCANPTDCSELRPDGDQPSGDSTAKRIDGNKQCPDSGRICNDRVCPNTCQGDHDGFSDNLDYAGNPYPTSSQRKKSVSGWPCVVVGAVCETWTTAGECVSGSEHSAGNTERHTDARQESNEPNWPTGL